jgi:hypothetical protein
MQNTFGEELCSADEKYGRKKLHRLFLKIRVNYFILSLERGMCNDFKSYKFCQVPFCEAGGAKSASSCQESCKISWEQEETIELAKNACSASHGVVASVSLLQDLLEIKKFINYKDVNLKAIFLIRDPRSVFRLFSLIIFDISVL